MNDHALKRSRLARQPVFRSYESSSQHRNPSGYQLGPTVFKVNLPPLLNFPDINFEKEIKVESKQILLKLKSGEDRDRAKSKRQIRQNQTKSNSILIKNQSDSFFPKKKKQNQKLDSTVDPASLTSKKSKPTRSRPKRQLQPQQSFLKMNKGQNAQVSQLKNQATLQFLFLLRLDNQIWPKMHEGNFKAYVQDGNNGVLIKACLKSRPWWTITSSIQGANLVWSEWKKKSLIQKLPLTQRAQNIQSKPLQNINQNKRIQINNFLNPKKIGVLEKILSKDISTLFKKKASGLELEQFWKKSSGVKFKQINSNQISLVNHLQGGLFLHNKKNLFKLINEHYKSLQKPPPIPLTFHIKSISQESFIQFTAKFKQNMNKVWIIKPGQNSNQGNGISVSDNFDQIKQIIIRMTAGTRTAILQQYIINPLLYNKRKFDMRMYVLITAYNGRVNAYWYQDGYIRTSSKQFNLKNLGDKMAHLTNDAVQKKYQQYGKYQLFNKIAIEDMVKYLQNIKPGKGLNFKAKTLPSIRQISRQLVLAAAPNLNPNNRAFSFQLFGLDFMVDNNLVPVIIEANSNPCLEVTGPVLGRIIPQLIQNVMRIAIDPLFYSKEQAGIRKSLSYSPQQVKFQFLASWPEFD